MNEFDLHLPNGDSGPAEGIMTAGVRKFTARLQPGNSRYDLKHNLGTEDVVVQTRIAGNVREGGVSILNSDTVRISFGGPLHEPMDVVVIG